MPSTARDSTPARWEHFFHEADIGIRGFGATREEAFEQAALALTGVLCSPSEVSPDQVVHVVSEGSDDELLLYDWLNSIIYEMATRRMLFGRYEVRLSDHRLEGHLIGELVDVLRHQPAVEIKGATLTELAVRGDDEQGWVAQCVVDV